MKKLIFTLSLFLSAFITNAQQNCFWHENFDAPSLDDSVTSYSSNIATNAGWSINSRLQVSPANCDSAYVTLGDTVILTTNSIDLTGMTFVLLDFDQICKVSFFDVAIIEISPDGGNTWLQLTETEYLTPIVNPPGAPFGAQGNQFSSASYAIWQPTMDSVVPDNSWWQHETFDISNFAGTFNDVKIRFVLYDSNIPGGAGNNGWKIDNICVTAAPCELTPPVIVQLAPILQNTVYNLGPYNLNVDVTDNSGIASVWMYFTINGVLDSVLMTNSTGTTWTGQIPAVNDSDTVCYYFVATDASACNNSTTYPVTGCIQFVASSGITFPFCDNFDTQNLWIDSLGAGSQFQLGNPNIGIPNAPHSAPNVWDVALNSFYVDNTDCYLISPVFSFLGITGAEISMWVNYNTELCCDWARVEYTLDGIAWTTLDNPGNTVNWYNVANGWGGSSAGWVEAKCLQPAALNNQAFVQFRYYFHTDFSITSDGFAVDDFCVIPPSQFDAGVAIINQPNGNAPAGNCLPVIVTLQNFGLDPLTSFDVYYSDGITTFGPYPWTGNLAPGATITDTLPCYNITAGTFNFCSWTAFAADGNNFNDTTCTTLVGVPTVVLSQATPYCENFDTGSPVWFNQNNGGSVGTDWQLGTPAFGTTNTAFSAPNSWDINLTSGYLANANVALYTPYFDISTAINPYLSFYVNFNTDLASDGVRLEYSINGQPWALLNPGIGTVNWYNAPNIFSSGQPAWAGNSATVLQNPTGAGWCNVKATSLGVLGAGTPNTFVQFRFVFTSDGFGNFDGFSVDDFCFSMPPAEDVGVAQIIQPTGNAPAGTCLPVIVLLQNYGFNTLTSFDIFYSNGGNTFGPFPWTGSLAPGDTISVILPCDTILSGTNTFCAWTALAADGNSANDTTCTTLLGVPTIALTQLAPYCDTFDSGNIGWFNQNNGGGAGSDWELGAPNFGTTNSALSAPDCWDINLNTTYGTNADVALYTPYFDISNAAFPYLEFNLNFNTEQAFDGTRLEYSINGQPWILLNPPTGTTNWYNMANIFSSGLPAWAGQSSIVLQNPTAAGWCEVKANDLSVLGAGTPNTFVQFRFVFTSDASVQVDGFSIDNFCFAMPAPFDAGVAQIIQPGSSSPAGNCDSVIVTLQNFGTNPLTSFNIYYTVDTIGGSTTYGPFAWTGNLLPGQTTTDTLPCFTIPVGSFNICSWTELITQTDGNHFNDTTCTNSVGVPVIVLSFANSYCDDFEGPNAGWSVFNNGNAGTIWEQGAPAFGVTTGAHSGTQAWDINLTTTYTANADVELRSPIFDFGNANDVILSFWRHHNTETAFDGVRLEYTTTGSAWNLLGTLGAPNPPYVNWYTNTIFANNLPAWAGNSPWIESRMTNLGLVGLNGAATVQFRFVFASDASVQVDGFSIDDFCLEVPVPLTASPTSVSTSLSFPCVFEGQNVTFTTTIKNAGTIPMNNVEATLVVDGTTIVTDPVTYSPALAPGASQVHSFSTTWLATIGGNHNVCVYTSNPNGQPDLNPTDDTTCFVVQVCDTIGISSTAPYCNDFEGGTPWYTFNALTYTPGTSWQLGTPAKATLNAAHSGTNAWITGLSANYPNQDTSGLFTPAFNVVGGEKYNLSFWHQFDTELFQDGGTVEYSTDYGATWTLLGNAGQGPQWYSSFFITALGGIPPAPGWSGFLPAYQFAQHEICFNQNSTVMFRFRFMSDFTVNHEGWVIDDVCFGDMNIVCPVGVQELVADNTLSLGQNYPNPVNGTTTIEYIIPENGNVQLSLVNMMGQMVDVMVQENENAGKHYVTFDTRDLAPGIYYYELVFNHERLVKKMVVTQ